MAEKKSIEETHEEIGKLSDRIDKLADLLEGASKSEKAILKEEIGRIEEIYDKRIEALEKAYQEQELNKEEPPHKKGYAICPSCDVQINLKKTTICPTCKAKFVNGQWVVTKESKKDDKKPEEDDFPY